LRKKKKKFIAIVGYCRKLLCLCSCRQIRFIVVIFYDFSKSDDFESQGDLKNIKPGLPN